MTQPFVSLSSADGLAEVRAHDLVMRYRRLGSGAILLLLARRHDEFWHELPALLAEHYRLVIPDLPDDAGEVAKTMACLLDGLGAMDVPVIAAGRYCDAALGLALGRNEYVGRVVLVPETLGPTSDVPSQEKARDPVRTIPLCVIPRSLDANEAFGRVLRFLRAPAGTSAG